MSTKRSLTSFSVRISSFITPSVEEEQDKENQENGGSKEIPDKLSQSTQVTYLRLKARFLLDLHESQKWRAGGQSYSLYSDVSELFQLVNYVQLKIKTRSGEFILGPTKYFPLVFCRAEHPAIFEHPRFA